MLPKTPAPATAAADQPRTFWNTVITTTPVIMTVLATILAGLSSSEMTRAQYDRATAAQFQAKAGDQWGFFQAKRTRGTVIAQDLDLYHGRPVRIEPARLSAAMQGVADALQTADRQAAPLREALAKTAGADSAGDPTAGTISQTLERVPAMAQEARSALAGLPSSFSNGPVAKALAYLGTDQLPHDKAQDRAVTDPAVTAALQALRERRPDGEVVALVQRISNEQIQEAITAAADNSKAFENGSQWVDDSLRGIDRAVKKLLLLGHGLHRAVGDVEAATADLTDDKNRESLRGAVAALTRTDRATQRRLATLADYTAARKDYTARRNRQEAGYNQQAAWPYELRVVKSSISSDRHRRRSQWFFAAMLGAQAATATASLALAARQKSTLWSLAGLVGLAALGFSVYIYLYF